MTQARPKRAVNTSERIRAWRGPVLLAYGHRPFFLLAGVWAAVAMALWALVLAGEVALPTRFDPVGWHAHEMLFGYLGAVLAGYLLGAIPNWTGRFPVIGWPLAALAGLWVLGRVAVGLSAVLPVGLAAVVDVAFGVVLALLILREILAGKSWRNLAPFVMVALFSVANALFHFSAARGGMPGGEAGFRLGLACAIVLISMVGGRTVPSLTRNWLVKQGRAERPVAFGRFDRGALVVTGGALVLWVLWPTQGATAAACLLAGGVNLIRLGRWAGIYTGKEPLVWSLHLGFLFVPLGFLAIGFSVFGYAAAPVIGAEHLWMAGAIGVMTLAVMTRTTLVQARREMTAKGVTSLIYLLVVASVLMRFVAALDMGPDWALDVALWCWIGGYGLFCLIFWPVFTRG